MHYSPHQLDDRVFGDLDSFRQQFGQLRDAGSFEALKHRISPICKRTLRRQVGAYVKYTKRIPLLREFKPGDDETRLYDLVSEYLQRLASSTFAIAGALNTLIRRLKQTLDEKAPGGLVDELDEDYESLGETADELGTDDADEEVQERLKVAQTDAKASLDRLERLLMRFTQATPDGHAASAAPRARARPRSPRSSSIRSCSEPWRPRARSKASCGKRWIYIQYWPHSGGCNEY